MPKECLKYSACNGQCRRTLGCWHWYLIYVQPTSFRHKTQACYYMMYRCVQYMLTIIYIIDFCEVWVLCFLSMPHLIHMYSMLYIIYIHITFWVADARNPQVCQCASIPRPSIWWRSRSLLLERPCEDQSLKTLKELRVNGSFSSLWTLLLQGLVLEKILDVEKMTAEWGPLQTIVSLCFPHSRPSLCLLVFLLTFWNCWQSRNQLRIPYRGGWKREEAWQRFSSEVTLVSNHL